MATPNISELLTTTLNNYSGRITDNVTKSNALLLWLSKRGNIQMVEGGVTIREELSFQENSSFRWYAGYDTLVTSQDDVLSASEYNYAQCAVSVSISGLEELQNAEGRWRLQNLLTSRIEVAENTLKNQVSAGLYSDGSADGGKQIVGLKTAIPDDPTTGTFGGISRSAYPFWQTQYIAFNETAGTHGMGAVSSGGSTGNFIQAMNKLAGQCIRGTDSPNLWIMDSDYWGKFQSSLQAIQRIGMPDEGAAGFASLAYYGGGKRADVVLDGGLIAGAAAGATSQHAWAINTDYLKFRPHRRRNFVPLDPERYSTNQDAVVRLIGFAGALTMRCAFVHGVLIEGNG